MCNVLSKSKLRSCTGCSACKLICPQKAISIELNDEGFYSPIINKDLCNNCSLCKTVCYKFKEETFFTRESYQKTKVYAVMTEDWNFTKTVSTVGVAYKLSETALKKGYNVISVIQDYEQNSCKHLIISNEKDLELTKGSKYIQSYCSDAFEQIDFDKKYIVFGTPCQIFGLKQIVNFKKKEHNFIFVDLYCIGIPTIYLWNGYKKYLEKEVLEEKIKKINFKDKSESWHKYSMLAECEFGKIYKESVHEDLFYKFFLRKVCFNRPCYNCHFRHDSIFSDIRLGDFWGEKYYSNDNGVGLVVVNSQKGEGIFSEIKNFYKIEENEIDEIYKSQRFNEYAMPKERVNIIKDLKNEVHLKKVYTKYEMDKINYKVERKK